VNNLSKGLLNVTSLSTQSNQSNQETERKVYMRPVSAGFDRAKSNVLSTVSSDILPSQLNTQKRMIRPTQSARFTRDSQLTRSIISNIGESINDGVDLERSIPTVPKYVETDKLVCRFYGYFYDERVWAKDTPLGTPDIEKEIVRKLTIYYYLHDNTVSMNEAVVNNSGKHCIVARQAQHALTRLDQQD
jgi:hypothetical protein